jgi:flagellar hook assembly protein FlgD
MTITIMTLTGQVVREITMDELGPVHIGLNRSRYKWDGTDEFGNRLANGVYLYKVNIRRQNGQSYDHFGQAKTDGFFKEGFGKMVIMR